MIEQQSRRYTIRTPMGQEVEVVRLSREDVEAKLAEFEAKYGMTSQEFVGKWNRGELDCAVLDYFDWEGYCDAMANEYGAEDLKIVYSGIAKIKI